jgi:hypothetical protein
MSRGRGFFNTSRKRECSCTRTQRAMTLRREPREHLGRRVCAAAALRAGVRRARRFGKVGSFFRRVFLALPFLRELAGQPGPRAESCFGRGGDALKKPSQSLTYSHLLSFRTEEHRNMCGAIRNSSKAISSRFSKPAPRIWLLTGEALGRSKFALAISRGVSIATWARARM